MKFYQSYTGSEDVFEKLSADGRVMSPNEGYADGVRVIHDRNTDLYWEVKSPDSGAVNYCQDTYTFEEAGIYAERLNKTSYGGYSDWRVPNKDELRSIIDYSRSGIAVDTSVFENCKAADYWTRNVYGLQPYLAWVIFFGFGSGIAKSMKTGRLVIAVRGGNKDFGSAVLTRFTDNGDGTVTDSVTGLMWQQGENERASQAEAAEICRGMTLGGYSDWRLPTIKELNTILNVDFTGGSWYFKDFFPAEGLTPPLLHYISGSTFMNGYVWVVNFCFGYDGYYGAKDAPLLFRAVRNADGCTCGTTAENKRFIVTHTGETKKYDIFGAETQSEKYNGLDCDRINVPMCFSRTDEGFVSDESTGLVWKLSDGEYTWEQACEYAQKRADGGRCWRLPDREELRSIIVYDGRVPAVNEEYFGGCTADFCWSAQSEKNDSSMAWTVYLGYGCAIAMPKTEKAKVLLVSGEKAFTTKDRFVIADDGTVSDTATGLMWMRDETPLLTLEEALAYCAELRLGGYSDWKLPTVKELGTIINLNEGEKWFFEEVFPNTNIAPQGFYLSSTTFDASFGWGCNFRFGFDGYYADRGSGKYPFRPVRYCQ